MAEQELDKQIAGVEEETAPEQIGRYLDTSGNTRPDLWRIGMDDLAQMEVVGGFAWDPAGPNPLNNLPDAAYYQGVQPVGGEVTDIAIDPVGAKDLILYAAMNNGGVWKTTDGGANWAATSDLQPSLSIGALALEPTGDPAKAATVIYAGSGNLFDGSGGFVKASGLYKSVDGGQTWFVTDGGVFGSVFAGVGINRIVCPAVDQVLVGTDKGLFWSADGGLNFGANSPAFDDGKPILGGFVSALQMDTADAKVAWVGIKGLDGNFDPFPGGGLFTVTIGAGGAVSPSANLLATALAGVRFGSLALTQSTKDSTGTANNKILYVSVQDNPPDGDAVFLGLWQSPDKGVTWNPLPNLRTQVHPGGTVRQEDNQSSYDFTLGVDPQNSNLVYAGFKRVWNSVNAGGLFNPCSQSQLHWDQHEMVFSPASHWGAAGAPTRIWVGSDGGIGTSTDGGNTWTQPNLGSGTHLFIGIDIGRGAGSAVTFGGSQDNGTAGHRAADGGTIWVAGIDGDGGMPAVDPADPNTVYGFDNSFLIKTTNGGADWANSDADEGLSITGATNASPIVVTANGHLFQTGDQVQITGVQGNTAANSPVGKRWSVHSISANTFRLDGSTGNAAYTPNTGYAAGARVGRGLKNPKSFSRRVALVPNGGVAATTVYVAEVEVLWKSTDGGASFTEVKSFGASVSALVCPDAVRVWVGTTDGKAHLSLDGGSSWKDFSPGGSGPVTGIAVDPADVTHVVVVHAGFSGISSQYRTKHCFATTNQGDDWVDISGTDGVNSGNLPDLPLHSVALDGSATPPAIIAGSEGAVLRSMNNGLSWQRLGAGLPRATCRSLAIDNTDKSKTPRLLRVGTYGRSAFELKQFTGKKVVIEANLGFGTVAAGQTATVRVRVANVGDASVGVTSFGRTSGDPDIDVASAPDLSPIDVGKTRGFDVKFTGGAAGVKSAVFTLVCEAGTFAVAASGVAKAGGKPRLAVTPGLNFGEVDRGSSRLLNFSIGNTGLANLAISKLQFDGSGDFNLTAPAAPLTLTAGAAQSLTISFTPGTWGGGSSGKVHIESNDPRQPSVDVPVTGNAPFNVVLLIAVIALGAAAIAGGAVAYAEATKKK